MQDVITVIYDTPAQWTVGRLGTSFSYAPTVQQQIFKQIDTAERRILRLEAALRHAGIEVEETDLPK
jgi:hypothetical protein